jgi:outer membrane protein assembly factor BamB
MLMTRHCMACPRLRMALLSLLGLAAASSVFAADWLQWRGPNRDGASAETGLLKDWPTAGPPLAWYASGLGEGYSSIVTSGNRVLTTGDKGESSYVIALNLADGKPLWSAKLGRGGAPGWGEFAGPRGTVTVDGDLAFAVGQWGELVCLTTSGQERWRKDFSKDFGGPRPEWGFSESPLVDGDKVVFTPGGPGGAIVALNKKTGDLLWRSKEFTDAAHYASLVGMTLGGVRQYTQLTDASVAGVSAADGKLLWRASRRGATAVIPTPIALDGFVYVTSGYGIGCNLFQVTDSGGKFQANQVYANKVMVNHHGGVVRRGDYIYGYSDGKGWTCQEWKTGKAVWQEKGELGKGSLVYADERLYLRAEDGKGTVALIEPSPARYKEHGRFDPPKRSDKNSWAHPVIAGGKLYLRDQDVLLCYDVKAK